MGMSKENASDGRRTKAADDGIEKGRRIGKCVRPIVSREDVSDYPCPLPRLLACSELSRQEGEDTRGVWVGVVPVVEDIVYIPEVGIDRDDPKSLGGGVSVGAIVRFCVLSLCCCNPRIVRPH